MGQPTEAHLAGSRPIIEQDHLTPRTPSPPTWWAVARTTGQPLRLPQQVGGCYVKFDIFDVLQCLLVCLKIHALKKRAKRIHSNAI